MQDDDRSKWQQLQEAYRKKRLKSIKKHILNSRDGQTRVITANDIEENVDLEASRGTVIKYMGEVASDHDDMRVEEKGGATILICEPDPPDQPSLSFRSVQPSLSFRSVQPSLSFRSVFDYVNGKTYDGRIGKFYFAGIVGVLGPLLYAMPTLLAFVVDPIPASDTFATTLVAIFLVSIVVLLLTVPRTDPDALQAKPES